ncbi:hypothetical protein, partial [Enterobacter intestinihominis]
SRLFSEGGEYTHFGVGFLPPGRTVVYGPAKNHIFQVLPGGANNTQTVGLSLLNKYPPTRKRRKFGFAALA